MAKANPGILAHWMRSFRTGLFWEHQFGGYELKPQWGDNPDEVAARKAQLKFYRPQNHVGKSAVGMEFEIREGKRTVATGRVTKILYLEENAGIRTT